MSSAVVAAASGNGNNKKRKKPSAKKKPTLSVSIAARSAVGGSVTSVASVRNSDRKTIINEYHTLVKQRDTISLERDSAEKTKKLATIDEQMEAIGGLQRYQEASIKGHTGQKGAKFNTGKWVMEILRGDTSRNSLPPVPLDPDRPPPLTDTTRAANIAVLDVGALTNHYLPYAHMVRCTAIDLNPCHPTVTKMDFFDLDPYKRSYDVVVLSLVVNFVGDKRKRGQMLADSWLLLSDRSVPSASSSSSSTSVWCPRLFLILPRPCMDNSRYLTHDTFVNECMAPLGFELDAHKMSAGLAFYCFKRLPTRTWPLTPWKSPEIRHGAGHNNFAIVIDPDICSPPLTTPSTTRTPTPTAVVHRRRGDGDKKQSTPTTHATDNDSKAIMQQAHHHDDTTSGNDNDSIDHDDTRPLPSSSSTSSVASVAKQKATKKAKKKRPRIASS